MLPALPGDLLNVGCAGEVACEIPRSLKLFVQMAASRLQPVDYAILAARGGYRVRRG